MENTIDRKRKSVQLTKEEHRAFVKYFRSFHTKTEAEEAIGVKRQVLDLVSIKGSGSPVTIQRIREMINQNTAA
jgi:hypothetical protein